MSKNTLLSQNYSRSASNHEFDVKTGSIIVANNRPYGAVSIEQVEKGITYPNVQSAIDDLASLFVMPINSVITNTDGISPSGVSQVDYYTLTGVVSAEGKVAGETTLINVFGFFAEVIVGQTAEEASASIRASMESAAFDGIAIDSVTIGPTLDIIQVKYNDYQEHTLNAYTDQGVTITPTIITPAKGGYGTWSLIGTEVKSTDPVEGPLSFYYFRRDN